jgi:CBS domain-containing protein
MTGKTIKCSKVIDIVTPAIHPTALEPHVCLYDPLTHAIEVMAEHNIDVVAVMQNHQVIGVARLSDALRRVGLCH